MAARELGRHPHDGSWTRVEARLALQGADEDAEDIATSTRRFALREITSGLLDDSRKADENRADRALREMRARVKVARAVVAATLGLAELLAKDRRKATRFYAKLGITEEAFRNGVLADDTGSENARAVFPSLEAT